MKNLKTIFYTAIIIVLLILIKGQYSSHLLSCSSYGMPALIRQQNIDNLYIGSSMFRQGLDINTLEQNTDSSHYILAYNGNQPIWIYQQLLNLINHNVDIETLYIDMYVYSAWEYPKIDDEKLFMEIGLSEKWKIWNALLQNPSTNDLETFWHIFVSANNELLLTWPAISSTINSQFHNGGTLTHTASVSKDVLDNTSVPMVSQDMNSIQKESIEKIIKLSKENNINLIFVETPKYKTITDDISYINAMDQYVELLNKEQVICLLSNATTEKINSYPNNYTYSFDNSDNNYYIDLIHLSYEGRVEFTNKLFYPFS